MKWMSNIIVLCLLCVLSYVYALNFQDFVKFDNLTVSSVQNVFTGKLICFFSLLIISLIAFRFNKILLYTFIFFVSVYVSSLLIHAHVNSYLSAVSIVNVIGILVIIIISIFQSKGTR